jgi:AraC-like DNA-binding protein
MDGATSAIANTADGGSRDGLLSALAQLIDLADRALESDRLTTRAYLARAAALVQSGRIGAPTRETTEAALAPWQIRRLTDYIDAHLAGPICSGDLTAIAQMSTGHFFRLFKRSYGDPPFAYIARRRIRKAQELMLTTDHRLCEIALSVGLCDQSHLTRVFRKWVGESPSAWRRRMVGRANVHHRWATSD